MSQYDWDTELARVEDLLHAQKIVSWTELAERTEIPRKTLTDAAKREGAYDRLASLLDANYEEDNATEENTDVVLDEEDLHNPTITTPEDSNISTATSCTTQIRSPDELWEALGSPDDEWIKGDGEVKKYDGWRANTEKDLVYKDGRIAEGFVRTGGIITKTLYSVSLKLIRRHREPILPTFSVIQPLNTYTAVPAGKSTDGWVRTLLFSDVHLGYHKDVQTAALTPMHNRGMMSVILQVARDLQPNVIGILGDLFDMSRWTRRFPAKQEYYMTTQPAFFEGHWWLHQFRAGCPDTRIIFIPGNHEERLIRYQRKYAQEAEGLKAVGDQYAAISVPHLLGLEALGIEWIDSNGLDDEEETGWSGEEYDDHAAYVDITPWARLMHGHIARKAGGATVRELLDRASKTIVAGHTHRSEMQVVRFRDEDLPIMGLILGCCCHLDGRVPGGVPDTGWENVFAVADFPALEPGLPSVELVPYRYGRALCRGRTYTEIHEDYIRDSISSMFPDEDWRW